MLIPKYYEDLKIVHENTMPYRAYYIPASKSMGNLVEDREKSDRMQLLNGKWKFKYCKSIYDLKKKFYEKEEDTKDFETVTVPGVWQNYGYDVNQYTNIRYPIPLDPPYVPQENPCGAYVYEFEYHTDKTAPKAYLNFEGVDSCFYVWLNGEYVGYSQVSHATSEFDVTKYLNEGKNKLAVLVLKWCDGTYLEDQDKFRMSGIFRDVYILKRPKTALYDYFITTQVEEKYAKVNVRANFLGKKPEVKIYILDLSGEEVADGMFSKVPEKDKEEYSYEAVLKIKNPILWNPEQPYLYTIKFRSDTEVITDRIGIRKIEVKDKIVYVNDKKIKFKGVNRHDFDPKTGFVISLSQIKRDLEIIKQNNFNAIRSSHYPNSPYFYQLCDEYGFFVIDEADNESHGTQTQYLEDASWDNVVEHWNKRIANNPDFIYPTLDRTKLCVHREKNRPCIVIWSMGNECAYGCTFEESLKWTKEFDKTRLTHYESAFYRCSDRKYDYSNIDLHSRMYPSFEEMREYLNSNPDKPYILVEYCHAMGNGPGDLQDYFKLIEENDIICGGFVWEFCDHAIYKGKAENGKDIYYYGGDHGESLHDGNFCMDGLVYPDRTPHTGLLEYKNVYRPARVASYKQESGKLILHNHMDYVDLKDYIDIAYEVNCDGKQIESGHFELKKSILPHKEGELFVPVRIPEKGKCYLKIMYRLKKQDIFRKEGYELGFDEIMLENQDGKNQVAMALLEKKIENQNYICVEESERYLRVYTKTFDYIYSKLTGLFAIIKVNGKKVLNRPMEVNIWRAPTDNDRKIKLKWLDAHYNETVTRAYETSFENKRTELRIQTKMSVAAASIQRILDIDAVWRITNTGEIYVKMNVKKNMEFPELPRFGLRLFLNQAYKKVTYYGVGPMESYIDKCQAGSHGLFVAEVEEMHEDYIKPQENGSHTDCDYVVVESKDDAVAIVSERTFSFNASVYTQEELTSKNHNYELISSDSTVLCVDYAQAGIGSNSCGPELSEQYKLNLENFVFETKFIFQNAEQLRIVME